MITEKEEAEKEFTISNLILEIDPERTYFITANSMCEHDQTDIKNTNEPQKCKQFPLKGPTYLISYENGGDNLSKLTIPANLYPKFFVGLIGLIEGLMILHQAEMAHLDIKPDNLVAKFYGDHYKIRYIDFGLSSQLATLNANSEHVKMITDYNLDKPYPYYPFDMLMTSLDRQQRPIIDQKEISKWYKYIEVQGARLPRDFYWLSNRSPRYNAINLSSEYAETAEWYANLSNHLKSVDMFSLGVSLCAIYARITGHIRVYDTKTGMPIISILAKGKIYSKEYLRLEFGEDVYSFHVKLGTISIRFYDEMNKLLLPFGNLRPTAEELYKTLGPILRSMDSVFGDAALTYKALKEVGVDVGLPSITRPLSNFIGASELPDPTNPTESLPPGWEKHINSDGRPYYLEVATGTSQWVKPPMSPPGKPPQRVNPILREAEQLRTTYGQPAVPQVSAVANPMNPQKLNYRRLMPNLYRTETNPMNPQQRGRTRKNRRSN
jgi:serine/threonine protein kinase